VQEAEVAAAGAQERERAAGERMTQAASRMAVMEAQVGRDRLRAWWGCLSWKRAPDCLLKEGAGFVYVCLDDAKCNEKRPS
jgi:hypothetical protein